MYTIKRNSISNYEIRKSKFITLLYKITSLDDINKIFIDIRNTYKDATHYTYAYKIGNTQKFSDDGEPGGTAGLPIIEVLNKRNIDYVLCIVVRYFGGIKLGAGGLVRAYGKSVKKALDKNSIIELIPGYLIEIKATYEEQKQLDYQYSNKIKEKIFDTNITYYIELTKEELDNIKYDYKIIKEILIEKES